MLWLDPSLARGRAALPRGAPGHRDLALPRRGTRQDHARDPQGRDGAPAASCRSAGTTAASTPRRCSSCWPAPMPTRTGDLGLIDELWPPCWRPWPGSRATAIPTATASSTTPAAPTPGSPTRAGRTARIRCSTPTAATPPARSRWSRCRATSTRRSGPWPISPPRRGEPADACAAGSAKAERLRAAVEERFWLEELGTYALALDGAGPALPGARLQPGPPAVLRPARAGPGRAGRGPAAGRRLQHRLGHPHAGARRAALQPDVLPQRLGLAARHRAVRRRDGALRRARRRGAAPERHVRDRGQVRHAAARAVLRLRAPAGRAADRLSGRLPAAGLGGGLGVHDAAGLPGARASTAGAARSTSTGRACRSASTG